MNDRLHAMPGRDQVETWLANIRSEIERVGAAIEPLMSEQSRLREREALLMKLLRTMDEGAAVPNSTASVTAVVTEATRMIEGSVLDYVRAGVTQVLREHGGGPMHINDIHAKFVAKGFRVPGAGRPANLTAHLSRAQGILSPTRGFYSLAEPPMPEGTPAPVETTPPAETTPNSDSNANEDIEVPAKPKQNKQNKGRNRKRR